MTKTAITIRCPASRSGAITVPNDGPITFLAKAAKNYVKDRLDGASDSFTNLIESPYYFFKSMASGPRHSSATPVSGGSSIRKKGTTP